MHECLDVIETVKVVLSAFSCLTGVSPPLSDLETQDFLAYDCILFWDVNIMVFHHQKEEHEDSSSKI